MLYEFHNKDEFFLCCLNHHHLFFLTFLLNGDRFFHICALKNIDGQRQLVFYSVLLFLYNTVLSLLYDLQFCKHRLN